MADMKDTSLTIIQHKDLMNKDNMIISPLVAVDSLFYIQVVDASVMCKSVMGNLRVLADVNTQQFDASDIYKNSDIYIQNLINPNSSTTPLWWDAKLDYVDKNNKQHISDFLRGYGHPDKNAEQIVWVDENNNGNNLSKIDIQTEKKLVDYTFPLLTSVVIDPSLVTSGDKTNLLCVDGDATNSEINIYKYSKYTAKSFYNLFLNKGELFTNVVDGVNRYIHDNFHNLTPSTTNDDDPIGWKIARTGYIHKNVLESLKCMCDHKLYDVYVNPNRMPGLVNAMHMCKYYTEGEEFFVDGYGYASDTTISNYSVDAFLKYRYYLDNTKNAYVDLALRKIKGRKYEIIRSSFSNGLNGWHIYGWIEFDEKQSTLKISKSEISRLVYGRDVIFNLRWYEENNPTKYTCPQLTDLIFINNSKPFYYNSAIISNSEIPLYLDNTTNLHNIFVTFANKGYKISNVHIPQTSTIIMELEKENEHWPLGHPVQNINGINFSDINIGENTILYIGPISSRIKNYINNIIVGNNCTNIRINGNYTWTKRNEVLLDQSYGNLIMGRNNSNISLYYNTNSKYIVGNDNSNMTLYNKSNIASIVGNNCIDVSLFADPMCIQDGTKAVSYKAKMAYNDRIYIKTQSQNIVNYYSMDETDVELVEPETLNLSPQNVYINNATLQYIIYKFSKTNNNGQKEYIIPNISNVIYQYRENENRNDRNDINYTNSNSIMLRGSGSHTKNFRSKNIFTSSSLYYRDDSTSRGYVQMHFAYLYIDMPDYINGFHGDVYMVFEPDYIQIQQESDDYSIMDCYKMQCDTRNGISVDELETGLSESHSIWHKNILRLSSKYSYSGTKSQIAFKEIWDDGVNDNDIASVDDMLVTKGLIYGGKYVKQLYVNNYPTSGIYTIMKKRKNDVGISIATKKFNDTDKIRVENYTDDTPISKEQISATICDVEYNCGIIYSPHDYKTEMTLNEEETKKYNQSVTMYFYGLLTFHTNTLNMGFLEQIDANNTNANIQVTKYQQSPIIQSYKKQGTFNAIQYIIDDTKISDTSKYVLNYECILKRTAIYDISKESFAISNPEGIIQDSTDVYYDYNENLDVRSIKDNCRIKLTYDVSYELLPNNTRIKVPKDFLMDNNDMFTITITYPYRIKRPVKLDGDFYSVGGGPVIDSSTASFTLNTNNATAERRIIIIKDEYIFMTTTDNTTWEDQYQVEYVYVDNYYILKSTIYGDKTYTFIDKTENYYVFSVNDDQVYYKSNENNIIYDNVKNRLVFDIKNMGEKYRRIIKSNETQQYIPYTTTFHDVEYNYIGSYNGYAKHTNNDKTNIYYTKPK